MLEPTKRHGCFNSREAGNPILLGLGLRGLGFRVWGLGAQGLGFRVYAVYLACLGDPSIMQGIFLS